MRKAIFSEPVLGILGTVRMRALLLLLLLLVLLLLLLLHLL